MIVVGLLCWGSRVRQYHFGWDYQMRLLVIELKLRGEAEMDENESVNLVLAVNIGNKCGDTGYIYTLEEKWSMHRYIHGALMLLYIEVRKVFNRKNS